jgi:hypothetical protein
MKNLKIIFLLFCSFLFISNISNAQLEVAHLSMKGFSAIGLGGFLNVGIPISEGASVTGELGLYSFKHSGNQVLLFPILLGYRHTINNTGSGIYLEPVLGYTIGATDITKSGYGEQKASGVTAGIGTGYIFPGRISFNLGLCYKHIFISSNPSPNIFSLRVSHSFSLGRRDDY